MNYFIGIDVGTSATKSVLFDETGKIVNTSSKDYDLIQPKNGWAEQRPLDWKNAALVTLSELSKCVDANSIKGVGLSGQMHGLVALDKDGNPLCNSIIWCDQRTDKEVEEVISVIGKEKYLEYTLNAPNTSFTLMKLLWVRNNLPDVYSKISKVLLPKDYINYCLTGNYSTDVSDASGTGYFDVTNRTWSKEILDAFDIPMSILPTVFESCEKVGNITKEVSDITGLSEDTIVVAGAGDQAAAALGNGIIEENTASVSLGTSGVVFSPMKKPLYDKEGRTHTFCHAVPNMWHVMGVTQACGYSVSWFKNNMAKQYSYKELDENSENISSDGIIFLPYLNGERTPYLDPDCRASFVGLSANHNTFNMYKAVLEGVCFSLRDCATVMQDAGIKFDSVRACGGGATSNLWLSLLADITNKEVCVSESSESGAMGVALLASVGSGVYKDVYEATEKMNKFELSKSVKPSNSPQMKVYDQMFKAYKALYYAIKNVLN